MIKHTFKHMDPKGRGRKEEEQLGVHEALWHFIYKNLFNDPYPSRMFSAKPGYILALNGAPLSQPAPQSQFVSTYEFEPSGPGSVLYKVAIFAALFGGHFALTETHKFAKRDFEKLPDEVKAAFDYQRQSTAGTLEDRFLLALARVVDPAISSFYLQMRPIIGPNEMTKALLKIEETGGPLLEILGILPTPKPT